jgi:putative transposase
LFAAFQNFFASRTGKKRQVGYPRFKAKHAKQSYTTNNINDNIKIDFTRKKLKLPKIDTWTTYRDDRTFTEPIKSVTVSKTKSGKYQAAIRIEREVSIEPKQTLEEKEITAFDMSFSSFLVSENERRINPRFYRKLERKVKTLHRQLLRKQKGSCNRAKVRVKLARIYEEIGNARTDWLHKQSLELARKHDAVILEDVSVEGMKQFNPGFTKTITLDFAWGEFTRMLGYKMERLGKHLVLVDRFFPSSKRCSTCGYINTGLQLAERAWTWPQCRTHHNRDVNAAKNLKQEGMRLLQEERNVRIQQSSTAGTAGSYASGDRVRSVGDGR